VVEGVGWLTKFVGAFPNRENGTTPQMYLPITSDLCYRWSPFMRRHIEYGNQSSYSPANGWRHGAPDITRRTNFYSQHVTNRKRRNPPEMNHIKISTRNINHHSQSLTLASRARRPWFSALEFDGYTCRTKIVASPCAINENAKIDGYTFSRSKEAYRG
jgi:hypothetical protein